MKRSEHTSSRGLRIVVHSTLSGMLDLTLMTHDDRGARFVLTTREAEALRRAIARGLDHIEDATIIHAKRRTQ